MRRRGFAAADGGNLLADWSRFSFVPNDELSSDLGVLRARSRNLWKDSAYVRGWVNRIVVNVVGCEGIRLQPAACRLNGNPDEAINRRILPLWSAWVRKGNCTVDGQQSFRDVQASVMEHIVRDGEAIVRIVLLGGDLRLQIIDPDRLDLQFESGSNIKMGVETDEWGRPTAYHIRRSLNRGDHMRIAAPDIVHCFTTHFAGQRRGIPWLHAAMVDANHLAKYRESELTAARLSSNKLGFYEHDAGMPSALDEEDLPIELSTPGSFHNLPAGTRFTTFDPTHPNGAFADFEKAILRGMAASVGSSYTSFANDLEGVSYSSIRQGTLDEREVYRSGQTLLRDHFLTQVYSRWVFVQAATGRLKVGSRPQHLIDQAEWMPRGWQWIDPLKEAQAAVLELDKGLTSRTKILSQRGVDYRELLKERAKEREIAEAAGEPLDLETDTDVN